MDKLSQVLDVVLLFAILIGILLGFALLMSNHFTLSTNIFAFFAAVSSFLLLFDVLSSHSRK